MQIQWMIVDQRLIILNFLTEATALWQSKMQVSVDLFIMQILIYNTSSSNPRGYTATHSLRRAWCRAAV